MPRSLMEMADIAPFEQIIVTKIGGDNWVNRMYSFVVPGSTDHVEARGAVAHLLNEGDLCCIITGTYFDQQQYQHYLENRLEIPIIDVRLYPDDGRMTNDLASAKTCWRRMASPFESKRSMHPPWPSGCNSPESCSPISWQAYKLKSWNGAVVSK